jgi:hypothetical protein
MPRVPPAGLLFNPGTIPFYPGWIREIEAAGQSGATELVGSDGEMETAIAALAQKPDSCLMIGPDPFNVVRIKQLAGQNRLPAISVYRPFAVEGGLMGTDRTPRISSGGRPAMSTAFSREPIRLTCPCSSRTSSNSSAT